MGTTSLGPCELAMQMSFTTPLGYNAPEALSAPTETFPIRGNYN